MLPSLEPDEAAKIWACTAIGRIGTPRKASFDKQARKVSGWITSFATDKHLRSIYRSKLMKTRSRPADASDFKEVSAVLIGRQSSKNEIEIVYFGS